MLLKIILVLTYFTFHCYSQNLLLGLSFLKPLVLSGDQYANPKG